MVGSVAALVSFEESSALLAELAGVPVGAKQVERTAEALGRQIAQDEQTIVESAPPPAPTMYVGMDGTGVPMRTSELQGRPGKQPDGSAKTREAKLVTVWSAESRDAQGLPTRDAGSVTYSAAIESAATCDTGEQPGAFVARVTREARRRGLEQATRRVVLGDGAPWIRNLADEHFPGAIQIVDLYHAKGHLSDVAKAIYGAGSDFATQWAQQRHDELDRSDLDALLSALERHAQAHAEARKCRDYVTRNRHRMRYSEFRVQGLCVGSGVVEAGCKTVIATRLKRAGMHWTLAGATPSSPCAPASSAHASRTSGSAAPPVPPPERMSQFWRAPLIGASLAKFHPLGAPYQSAAATNSPFHQPLGHLREKLSEEWGATSNPG
jgi:hypothetical protein